MVSSELKESKINKEILLTFVNSETHGVNSNGKVDGVINLIVGLKNLESSLMFKIKMMVYFGWTLKISMTSSHESKSAKSKITSNTPSSHKKVIGVSSTSLSTLRVCILSPSHNLEKEWCPEMQDTIIPIARCS